jgi:hypothetical protein
MSKPGWVAAILPLVACSVAAGVQSARDCNRPRITRDVDDVVRDTFVQALGAAR